MSDDLQDFRWAVSPAGYRWVEGFLQPQSDPHRIRPPRLEKPWSTMFLVKNDSGGELRDYQPSTNGGLFREFAGVEPEPPGIGSFAGRYGLLTDPYPFVVSHDPGGSARPGDTLDGVSMTTWTEPIKLMRDLLRLWDLCLIGNDAALRQHILWGERKDHIDFHSAPKGGCFDGWKSYRIRVQIILRKDPSRGLSAKRQRDDEWFERMEEGDVILPALVFVQRQVNENLRPRASPRLLWEAPAGALRLTYRPATLLDVLWLQFATDMDGKIGYRECGSCRRWIRLGGGGRADRSYCSNACRTRGLRWRQERAVELHQAGKTAGEIAAELGSDVGTVAGWIRRRDEGVS